jgi:murein DD-endopeptidase MepM/ murein hydrolase activator NlpD
MGNHRAERRGPRRGPSATPDAVVAAVGRRRATRRDPSRGSLLRGLPSTPILLGVAALAVSAAGALTAAGPQLAAASPSRVTQASALTGTSDVSRADLLDARTAAVSRDSARDALADAADAKLEDLAESQARQRNAALAKFAQQAEAQAEKIALNQWVLPVDGYHLTATFGQNSGLWASSHTGLDFAAPEGTPIKAIANGVVTSTGYDGSYGNKTVVTLEDGTELWFCHQSAVSVSTGQPVRAGEVIGAIGSTGNVTGPHLHLEVRPGGGDPVDPDEALRVHGLRP